MPLSPVRPRQLRPPNTKPDCAGCFNLLLPANFPIEAPGNPHLVTSGAMAASGPNEKSAQKPNSMSPNPTFTPHPKKTSGIGLATGAQDAIPAPPQELNQTVRDLASRSLSSGCPNRRHKQANRRRVSCPSVRKEARRPISSAALVLILGPFQGTRPGAPHASGKRLLQVCVPPLETQVRPLNSRWREIPDRRRAELTDIRTKRAVCGDSKRRPAVPMIWRRIL